MNDSHPDLPLDSSIIHTADTRKDVESDALEMDILRRAAAFQENFDESESGESTDPPVRAVNPVKIVLRNLRGRYLIAACLAVLFSAVGATGGFLSKYPIYVSGGIIQLYPTKTNILYSDTDDSRLRLFDAFVASEASFLKSPPVLERAVNSPQLQELGWTADLDGMSRLKETVAVEKKGGLITVTTGHRDPVAAATLLNVVLDTYQQLNSERLKLQDSVRDRELSRREEIILKELGDLDKQILNVGQEYGVASIVEAHIRKITQSEDVDKRIAELSISIASMSNSTKTNDVDLGDAETKRLVILDQAMADMLFEQSKQQAELAVLEARHAPEHRDVLEMKARIAVIDKSIENRRLQLTTLGKTGALTKSDSKAPTESADDLKALRNQFVAQRTSLQQEARELNGRMIKLEFLKDERSQLRLRLEEIRRALEQIRLESNHTLPGTAEIKSRGAVATRPASDKRIMFCLAGGGFGAVGGVIVTLAYGLLLGGYRFSDDLSEGQPNFPMVGVLPAIVKDEPEDDAGFQRAIYRLGVDLQLLLDMKPGGKILAVTGTSGGSGTSTVALALARAFTNSRLKTVLVDADFTDGALTSQLGLTGSAGLRECLLNGSLGGQLVDSDASLLRTLPLGNSNVVSDSHIARRQFAHLLQQLRSQCDLVIVDLGPLTDRLVARMGSAIADRVLFVVPAGAKTGLVNPALADLERLAPHRALTILNFAVPSDPRLQAV
ncbi:MAG: hypothetical protein JWM11_3245 [Planctomycetaceae bacterium]|nr:hypothetical protein [Planctomycetaceae bacterium]